jgi:hypothetical protein
MNTIPTKMLLDNKLNQVIRYYEPVEESLIKQIYNDRLNICIQCKNFSYDKNIPKCNLCGCGLYRKINIIYSLDEDGKAIQNVWPNGEYGYVCKLKKW